MPQADDSTVSPLNFFAENQTLFYELIYDLGLTEGFVSRVVGKNKMIGLQVGI